MGTIEQIRARLIERHACENNGSYYDEIRIIQLSAVTPRSEVVQYKARRRQDHSHAGVFDVMVAVVTDGTLGADIKVPW